MKRTRLHRTLKGNRNWFDIANQIKVCYKPFDIAGVRYIQCSIQPSSTVACLGSFPFVNDSSEGRGGGGGGRPAPPHPFIQQNCEEKQVEYRVSQTFVKIRAPSRDTFTWSAGCPHILIY